MVDGPIASTNPERIVLFPLRSIDQVPCMLQRFAELDLVVVRGRLQLLPDFPNNFRCGAAGTALRVDNDKDTHGFGAGWAVSMPVQRGHFDLSTALPRTTR